MPELIQKTLTMGANSSTKISQPKHGYGLSQQYFDWAMEHPEENSSTHAGFMFWLIELNNRLGWKQKFGLPTLHTMEVLNIRSYKTYKKIFDDLVSWGFVKLHQKATNNHTANIIELVIFTDSVTYSLTNSLQNHSQSQDSLTDNLSVDIDKPLNNKTIKLINNKKKMPEISEIEIQDPHLKIAFNFWKLFKKIMSDEGVATTVLDKADSHKWESDTRLMIEKKECTMDQLREIYRWLKARETKSSKFWAANIMSMDKLREKLPKILMQMKQETTGSAITPAIQYQGMETDKPYT